LAQVKLEGFKSIRSADIELHPLNILIGPNGAGKSNFIGFFRFMNRLVQKELQFYVGQQGGCDKLLHFGGKVTNRLTIKLQFPPNTYECVLAPTPAGGLVFQEERAAYYGKRPRSTGWKKNLYERQLAPAGAPESELPRWTPNPSKFPQWTSFHLHQWRVYHFHDAGENSPIKRPCRTNDVAALQSDAANLAAFLRFTRDQESHAFEEIVATIRRVAPFFNDFVLEPEPSNPEYIRLRWKHVGSDAYFDGNDFSDGTLRFICLATLLLQPAPPPLILLDEPELGLHPYAVEILAGMMRSVSAHSQIIASTQSVTLANQFDLQDLIVVDLQDNASRFHRLHEAEYKDWLNDYRAGDLWVKNVIGGTP
jgi:predicted ATPase